jgi:predicted transcriptional regulator
LKIHLIAGKRSKTVNKKSILIGAGSVVLLAVAVSFSVRQNDDPVKALVCCSRNNLPASL